jgi:hypothetical protein
VTHESASPPDSQPVGNGLESRNTDVASAARTEMAVAFDRRFRINDALSQSPRLVPRRSVARESQTSLGSPLYSPVLGAVKGPYRITQVASRGGARYESEGSAGRWGELW